MQTSKKPSAINKKFIIFTKLCKEDSKTYSIEHAARKAGVDLKALKKWKKTIGGFEYTLDMCRFLCAINVGRAFSNGDITRKEADQYLEGVTTYQHDLDFFVMKAKEDDQRKKKHESKQ